MHYRHNYGFTFVELIAVVAILGIVTISAMPSSSPQISYQLQLTTEKIASAIRFARDRSISTEKPHGIVIDTANNYASEREVFVYNINTDTSSYSIGAIQHMPVSKQLYQFGISGVEPHAAVSISNESKPFSFDSVTDNKDQLHFDKWGIPVFYDGNIARRLDRQGFINLYTSQSTASVIIDPVTGRVTVQ